MKIWFQALDDLFVGAKHLFSALSRFAPIRGLVILRQTFALRRQRAAEHARTPPPEFNAAFSCTARRRCQRVSAALRAFSRRLCRGTFSAAARFCSVVGSRAMHDLLPRRRERLQRQRIEFLQPRPVPAGPSGSAGDGAALLRRDLLTRRGRFFESSRIRSRCASRS